MSMPMSMSSAIKTCLPCPPSPSEMVSVKEVGGAAEQMKAAVHGKKHDGYEEGSLPAPCWAPAVIGNADEQGVGAREGAAPCGLAALGAEGAIALFYGQERPMTFPPLLIPPYVTHSPRPPRPASNTTPARIETDPRNKYRPLSL